jgi:plasmid stabilization system protein ParE
MKEPLAVVFQRRATHEIEEIDAWWRANRSAAPDLFATELERTLAAVALVPTLGARAKSERLTSVRRVLLRRTRYHVYFRAREETLEVLAVWHAARGSEPDV